MSEDIVERRRAVGYQVRLSAAERAVLARIAQSWGLATSQVVRQLIRLEAERLGIAAENSSKTCPKTP